MTAARVATVATLALALAACSSSPAVPPDAPIPPWTNGPTLPGPRLEPGVTALGDQLVMVGGFDTSLEAGLHITNEVDTLDTSQPLADQAWSAKLPVLPRAWTHLQLAASGTSIYALGGLEGVEYTAKGDAFALDTAEASPAWVALPTLPVGYERGSAAVIVAGPRIYLLGGAGTTGALATNLYYDIVMNAWCPGAACTAEQQLPDLPAPRSHPAGMRLVDGTLVVVGGLATLDATEPEADVWWLPIDQQNAAGSWTKLTKTPMPTPRGGCAYGNAGGRLICAGGEAGRAALLVAELYEPMLDDGNHAATDVWTELPPMPMERAGAPGAVIGQRLFIPGGAYILAYEPLDTLLVLDLLDTPGDTGSAARLGSP